MILSGGAKSIINNIINFKMCTVHINMYYQNNYLYRYYRHQRVNAIVFYRKLKKITVTVDIDSFVFL